MTTKEKARLHLLEMQKQINAAHEAIKEKSALEKGVRSAFVAKHFPNVYHPISFVLAACTVFIVAHDKIQHSADFGAVTMICIGSMITLIILALIEVDKSEFMPEYFKEFVQESAISIKDNIKLGMLILVSIATTSTGLYMLSNKATDNTAAIETAYDLKKDSAMSLIAKDTAALHSSKREYFRANSMVDIDGSLTITYGAKAYYKTYDEQIVTRLAKAAEELAVNETEKESAIKADTANSTGFSFITAVTVALLEVIALVCYYHHYKRAKMLTDLFPTKPATCDELVEHQEVAQLPEQPKKPKEQKLQPIGFKGKNLPAYQTKYPTLWENIEKGKLSVNEMAEDAGLSTSTVKAVKRVYNSVEA